MSRIRTRRRSLQRKLLPVLAIFLSITLVSLLLTFLALGIQSSVRGYVAGEGLWSKTQRDAVFLLARYGLTRDPAYLSRFEQALAVPLGDRAARIELQKPHYDPAIATRGFLQGGNHPEDIAGMIRLFRCCSQISYIEQAIKYWTLGDEHVADMQELARQLKAEIESAAPSEQRIQDILRRLEAVNDSVRPLEAAFTTTLGDAARWVTRLLFLTTASIIFLLIALGGYVSWRILNSIRESEERYRLLLNTANDALIVIDQDSGTMLDVNAKAEQLMGRPAEALIGSAYGDYLPDPSSRTGHTLPVDEGKLKVVRHKIRNIESGRVIPIEVSYSATEWGNHSVRLAIIRDISERVQAERDLRVAANAMSGMVEGVIITDARWRCVSINRAFTDITGYSEADVIGKRPRYPRSRHNDATLLRSIWKAIRKSGRWQGEIWNQRKNGEPYPELLSVSAVEDENGKITHYVGVFNDISAYKEYERRLQHLAHHDALTKLPNRAAFEEHCERALERARRERTQLALLFIDLDGFKSVNDIYGHAVGDRLLETVGQRINGTIRGDDALARVGGDEFTVLLHDIAGPESAAQVAHKLLDVLAQEIQVDGQEISIFASIGISFFPSDAGDVQTLVTHADTAMYEAKNRGRNNVQLFTSDMASDTSSRMLLSQGLKQAIDKSQFELHYQPCVILASGEIASVEALLRWNHPTLGQVSPATFIPLAEEIGLINRIGDWVLRTACEQGMQWLNSGYDPVSIAVNVSPSSFWDPEFPAKIAVALNETGWPADSLCLEITENTIMHKKNPEITLGELHAMGVRLAIDDFGVGYSSLNYLKRFPVHYLKIDRDFTKGIPGDGSDVAITKAIIALARNLNLQVVAEGIETEAQYRFMRDEGCDQGQGYMFSRPLPAVEIERLFRQRKIKKLHG